MSLSQQLLNSTSQNQGSKKIVSSGGSASSRLLQNTQGSQTPQFQGYQSTSSIITSQPVAKPTLVQNIFTKFNQVSQKAGNLIDNIFTKKELVAPIPEEGILKSPKKEYPAVEKIKKSVSKINDKLGPLLFKIYTPLEYTQPGEITYDPDAPFYKKYQVDRSTIKEGVKPTAGKFIGGFIEDAMVANMMGGNVSVKQTRDIFKEGLNVIKGIKTAAIFSATHALINTLKEDEIKVQDLLVSGGFGFLLGSFEPTVMVGGTDISVDNAKNILSKYNFKNSDYKNSEILKTKFRETIIKEFSRVPVEVGHPRTKEYDSFIKAYNTMTSAGIDSKWSLPDINAWVNSLWEKNGETSQSLYQKANSAFKSFISKIITKDSKALELSPQSVKDIVIGSELQDSTLANILIKLAVDATSQGKNILITPVDDNLTGENIAKTPGGVNMGVRIVDPTENADKPPQDILGPEEEKEPEKPKLPEEKKVEEPISKELEPLAQEAKKYESAEEFIENIKQPFSIQWETKEGNVSRDVFKSGKELNQFIKSKTPKRIIRTAIVDKPTIPSNYVYDLGQQSLTDFYNQAIKTEPEKLKTPEIKPVKSTKIGTEKDIQGKYDLLGTDYNKYPIFVNKNAKEGDVIEYNGKKYTVSERSDDVAGLIAETKDGKQTAFIYKSTDEAGKIPIPTQDKPEKITQTEESLDDLQETLRGTKGMTADDITKKYPNIQLQKDVPAKDIYGNKVEIPEGEKLTPYELKGNKILLQDGETYIVTKNQFQNIKGQSEVAEGKPFAPELEGTEETVEVKDKIQGKAPVIKTSGKMFEDTKPTTKKSEPKKPIPKEFVPKKVEKTKIKSISVKDRKAIQTKTKEVAFSGKTQEEAIANVEKYMDEVFSQADDPTYTRKLKAIRAELKRDMYELVGADTGKWKRDYAFFQKLRNSPEVGELIDTIEDGIFRIDEVINPDAPPSMGGSLASSVTAGQIDSFEDRTVPKKGTSEFKLFEQSKALIRKYAQSIGEGYLPRNSLGVYYPATKNIRVNALNALSTVSHEITHFLDYQYNITDKLLAIKGYTVNGKPIYDPKTREIRQEITNIYTKYYPSGKKTHKLRIRAQEGFATLLQKYTETPNKISEEFPLLVNSFLKEGGDYYHPIMKEIIKDLNNIISEYQGLSSLDKIGSRITSDDVVIDKDSFLNFFDKVRTQLTDAVYPIEVLAKKSKTQFTTKDPSLWLRAYNAVSGIINTNISSKKGYWSLQGDDFKKIHDFNWKSLVDLTQERKNTDDFGAYLVARREYYAYKELEVMQEEIKRLEEIVKNTPKEELEETVNENGQKLIDEVKEAMTNYKELKSILDKDGFSREIVDEVYKENKSRFKEEEEMFDTLTRDDLDFLASENVQLITPSKLEKLKSKQGYASFKRQFYDEILGDTNEFPNIPKVSGTKASSLLRRKGSEKTIIHPMYSGIANHSEILRKGLKQVVYNKITDIGVSATFPNLFQEQQLKTFVNPTTGAFIYPQEKDPKIIMGRKDYKRKPVLVDAQIKTILDSLLTYENIEIFQRLYVGLSRMFTAGTTGMYPAFAASNFVVDQITAMANTTNKYTPIYSAMVEFKNVLKDKAGADYGYYEEYMVMGGERQTFTGWQKLPPNKLYRRINGERSGLEKATALISKGTDIFAMPSKYSEIVTRATEYIKARKAGKAVIVALEEAGRVTAPFHHLGKWGGKGGSTFIRGLPFFNATLQVLDQATRTVETHEGRKRTGAVMFLITTAYLASMLKLLRADDEQKEQYKDLEARELTNYIYFPHPSGQKLIRVKMSQTFSPLGAILNMIIADEVLKTNYSLKDYTTAATAWLPDQFNLTEPIQAFLSWIPQIFSVGVETIFNTKTYPQVSPIESMALTNLPPEMRTNENTSVFAKWLGKKAGLSPIKIDYLLTGYFGRSIGFATGKPSAYNFESNVIRDYYFSGGRRVSGLYDLKEKNDQNYTAYQRGEKDLSEEEVRELYRVKILTNDFGEIMRDYRKVDIEKDQENAARLRNEALQLINKVDNGYEPEGLDSWSKDAKKRRFDKIRELEKEKLSLDTSTKKNFRLIKQVQASELVAFTGSPKQEKVYQELSSKYTTGEASYYDPLDPAQTRTGADGTGAYGRKIESGSVAFGNRIFQDRLKAGEEIYIKVKGFEDIKTPYGNGVFRIDDTMNVRYNKQGQFNIDFSSEDIGKERKDRGRYEIEFKIVEPEKTIKFNKTKDDKRYFA